MSKQNIHLKYLKPIISEKKIGFNLLYGIFDNFPEEVLGACGFPCTSNSYCVTCTGYSTAFCNGDGECAY